MLAMKNIVSMSFLFECIIKILYLHWHTVNKFVKIYKGNKRLSNLHILHKTVTI